MTFAPVADNASQSAHCWISVTWLAWDIRFRASDGHTKTNLPGARPNPFQTPRPHAFRAGQPSACAFLIMEDGSRTPMLTALAGVAIVAAPPAFAQSSDPPRAEGSAGWSLLPANGDHFPRPTSHGVVLGRRATHVVVRRRG